MECLLIRGIKQEETVEFCRLLHRSDRNYDEAIKCYKNSLRMEKDNLTVLRDLAQLQIQMRDIPGFLESRQRLLELKPTNRQSWVSLALAHHLLGHWEVASTVLESYESTLDDTIINADPFEYSEILLYKVTILMEGGKHKEALDTLDAAENGRHIKDEIGALEIRAQLYFNMGQFHDAEEIYFKLLNINPDNYGYHKDLIKAQEQMSKSTKDADVLETLYLDLKKRYPDSTACNRIPLDFLAGDRFEKSLNDFVGQYIKKGIPSLFSEIKPLHTDASKAEIIGRVLEQYSTKTSGEESAWVLLTLAMHYDTLGDTEMSLQSIEKCINEKGDLIEAYSAKAVILENAGDFQGAAAAADHARKMDLADRYLNCQAAIALFKAGKREYAESVAHLFTKDGDQANNFYDMQATWYELASGNCYLENKDYGRALKRFRKIDEHFDDFVEDQFDFHAYCIRKQTMRAYVDMLRMLDDLYCNEVYAKAVGGAVRAYIDIFENPPKTNEELLEEKLSKMAPEEAKRERQRLRKMEAKKSKATENVELTKNNSKDKSSSKRWGSCLDIWREYVNFGPCLN